jgi:hypothetical protein
MVTPTEIIKYPPSKISLNSKTAFGKVKTREVTRSRRYVCGLTRVLHHKMNSRYPCLYHPSPFFLIYTAAEVVLCVEVSQQQKRPWGEQRE